jgi:cell division protein FtsN
MTRLTNGRWQSTLHRVVNPTRPREQRQQEQQQQRQRQQQEQQQQPQEQRQQQQQQQQQQRQQQEPRQAEWRPGAPRRLSVAYFCKPAYDAPIAPLPSCIAPGEAPRYAPALAADLTRAGVLARYEHLPPDEASRLYHEHMARTRSAAGAGAGP